MVRVHSSLAAALILIARISSASAETPSSRPKWVLNYAPSFCLLSRDRTATEPGVAIRTRPFEDEHEFVLMMKPDGSKSFASQGQLIIGDQPAGPDRWVGVAMPKGAIMRVAETTIRNEEMASAVTSGRIRLVVPAKLDAAVQLPNLGKATAALKACEDDLARRWKIVRTWVVNPVPTPDTHGPFRNEDTPNALVERGRGGSARAMLTIDETGRVTDCRIMETSGDPVVEQTVCKIYRKRARFTPAQDSTGKPVTSYYLAPTVRFMITD